MKNLRLTRPRDVTGFTLVELLVVVAIIGILASIALPIFLSQTNKAKEAGAKSAVINALIELASLRKPSFAEEASSEAVSIALHREDEGIVYSSTSPSRSDTAVFVVANGTGGALSSVELFSESANGIVYCTKVTSAGKTSPAHQSTENKQEAGEC